MGHPLWKEYAIGPIRDKVKLYNPATDVVLCFSAHFEEHGEDFYSHPVTLMSNSNEGMAKCIGSHACSRKSFQRRYASLSDSLKKGGESFASNFERKIAETALSKWRP